MCQCVGRVDFRIGLIRGEECHGARLSALGVDALWFIGWFGACTKGRAASSVFSCHVCFIRCNEGLYIASNLIFFFILNQTVECKIRVITVTRSMGR